MTFSMISQLNSYEDHLGGEHAFEAWEAIRRAQRVSWDAAHAQRWRAEFRRHIVEARDRMVAHHQASRETGSSVARFIAAAGGEARVAREHLAEHRWLRERLGELGQAVEARSSATIEDVVELTERAILLEIQLARHQNKSRGLVADSATGGQTALAAGATLRSSR